MPEITSLFVSTYKIPTFKTHVMFSMDLGGTLWVEFVLHEWQNISKNDPRPFPPLFSVHFPFQNAPLLKHFFDLLLIMGKNENENKIVGLLHRVMTLEWNVLK